MITIWEVHGMPTEYVLSHPKPVSGDWGKGHRAFVNIKSLCRSCGDVWATIVHHEAPWQTYWQFMTMNCPRHGGSPSDLINLYLINMVGLDSVPLPLLHSALYHEVAQHESVSRTTE